MITGEAWRTEAATVQFQHVLVRGQLLLKAGNTTPKPLLGRLVHFQQAGLLQESQVLGHVVFRNLRPLRDGIHAQLLLEQQAHDPRAIHFAQGSQYCHALYAGHAPELNGRSPARQDESRVAFGLSLFGARLATYYHEVARAGESQPDSPERKAQASTNISQLGDERMQGTQRSANLQQLTGGEPHPSFDNVNSS